MGPGVTRQYRNLAPTWVRGLSGNIDIIALAPHGCFGQTAWYDLISIQQTRLSSVFFQTHNTIQSLFKGIVMADYDELVETAHATNLLGEVHAPQLIHILGWLIEEGDVEGGELFEQRQAYGKCRAHLLTAAQLSKGTLDSTAAQHHLVVVLPGEFRRVIT